MPQEQDPRTAGDGPASGRQRVGGTEVSGRATGRTRRDPSFPEDVLTVVTWADPVLDQLGHDPRSAYVERFWLPILGPSCLLLVRRLAAELERSPDGFTVPTALWAQELGIGMKGGQHSPFWRAVERAGRFGAARRNGSRLALRRRLPPLSNRQVQRLPPSLRPAHEEWAAARLERPRRATVTQWTPRPDQGVGPDTPDPTIEFDDAA